VVQNWLLLGLIYHRLIGDNYAQDSQQAATTLTLKNWPLPTSASHRTEIFFIFYCSML
jgi:hypothetical protein